MLRGRRTIDAAPCRELVGAACTFPPCPSLALALENVAVPLVVVAGKRAVDVLRPELPYTSSVACGDRTIVVPSTVIVPPGVSVCPSMTNAVPVPGAAMYVLLPIVKSGGFVIIASASAANVVVAPLITSAVAPAASEMVVPATTTLPPGVSIAVPI